jgi:hypothetical protein
MTSENTYGKVAAEKLWQARNAISLTASEREHLIAEAHVFATLHLANVTEQAQRPQTADSERLDTLQQAYDHLKGMYDQMAVRYARLLDGAEKVVNDPDEEKVVGCDHVEGGEIPHTTEGINVWLYFAYCPKCGEKL